MIGPGVQGLRLFPDRELIREHDDGGVRIIVANLFLELLDPHTADMLANDNGIKSHLPEIPQPLTCGRDRLHFGPPFSQGTFGPFPPKLVVVHHEKVRFAARNWVICGSRSAVP